MRYYAHSEKEVLLDLKSNSNTGLSSKEAEKRLNRYGLNELREKKGINPILLFIAQFRNFIIYILLFAVLISVIAQEVISAIVILIILFFNAGLGFFQELKAEHAIEALRKLSGFRSKVIRDKKIIQIDTKHLCPGDILILEEGVKVPADARILSAINLSIEESSLTGESQPVIKTEKRLSGELQITEQSNMIFSGTSILRGRGCAIVTNTGMNTEIGKIAEMITDVKDEMTPLQKKLEQLGKWIGLGTIIICIIIFFAGVAKDGQLTLLLNGEIFQFVLASKEWFLTAIALAVAAVPEGLPAIVTISLAIGVKKMLKKNALIRKLSSVETLGESTVICSDKTGTITQNKMTIEVAYTNKKELDISGTGYNTKGTVTCKGKAISKYDELLFKIGLLCNDASLNIKKGEAKVIGDPTEGALIVSSIKAGLDHEKIISKNKRQMEEPFDSIRKIMSTVNYDSGSKKKYVYTKGAPEIVLKNCSRIFINGKIKKITPKLKKQILKKNEAYAKKAYRVLAFAYKDYKGKEDLERDLIFVGIQGMLDPPHVEVKGSVQKCKDAGIRVIMITGDHGHTAQGIARQIGINGKSINGEQFSKLSRAKKIRAIKEISIFSRVLPEHKIEIVSLLQSLGHIVTMTGDGVNDAPAIKKADLGISMGISGTDVTKEASKMVIMDDKFTTIVDAIEEGRGIYTNIKKFVNYLLSSNIAEVMIIFVAILLNWNLPLTAIMLLWLNLVTDGFPALALSLDPYPKDIMKKPPKKAHEGIMNRYMAFQIFYVSIIICAGVLGLFYWASKYYAYLPKEEFIMRIQTIALSALIVMEIVRIWAIRSEYKLSIFSNKYLIYAILLSIGLQFVIIYTPLSFFFKTTALSLLDWTLIMITGAIVFGLNMVGLRIKQAIPYFRE